MRRHCRTLILLLAAASGAPVARPQSATTRPVASDLAARNLDRVAASAAQIEQVLRQDAGLLVELKRWIASEATDQGRIVDDASLTDQSIFDRLASDLRFRAVATRLVQRYGYLLPKVAAGSEAAQEAEARRLTAAHAVESVEVQAEQALAPRGSTTSSRSLAWPSPDRGQSLARPGEAGQIQGVSVPSLPPGAPKAVMSPEAPVRTGDSPALAQPLTADTGAPSERGRNLQRLSPPKSSLHAAQEVFEGGYVLRPSPYADIPSIYDLYRQVAPQGAALERFGLDVFHKGVRDPELLPMDLPVGPDYVLGPGDSLAIDLWGSVSQRLFRTVDHEGRLALPEVGPVLVSGRTLGEVQQAVQQLLRTQFRDVSADLSLSRLRTIRVYVVGDVEQPGAYDISSLSTPLNALFAAGGPTVRGSLRLLRHYRGRQLVQEVDVYDLLLRGVRTDLKRLDNGDTVLVPPIGGMVSVEGAVRRPAIYELRQEKSLADVLAMAGGILSTAMLRRIQVQRVEAHEKRTMLSLDVSDLAVAEAQLRAFELREGDEVRIFPIAPYNQDAVYLEGHVLRPGRYSFRPGMKLTELITTADLLPEPASQYAEIIRLVPPEYRPQVESFELGRALADPAAAPTLEPMDTVRIFSRYDFEAPPTVWVGGEVWKPGPYRTAGRLHLREAIHLAGGLTPDAHLEDAQVFRELPDSRLRVLSVNLRRALAGDPTEDLLLEPRDRIVVHSNPAKVDPPSVAVRGEVAKPGRYPLAAGMRISDLIRLAGGLKRSAYAESADLTRYLGADGRQHAEHREVRIAAALAGHEEHDLLLRDGDALAIRPVAGWSDIGASVVLRGEVAHPGGYGIQPGERLSSVLKRAGGFLPTAWPQAAVLERQAVRELQQKSREDLIRRLEAEANLVKVSLAATPQEQAALQQAALQQRERVLESLRRAPVSGRLVILLPRHLSKYANSPEDIELRDGDVLTIPKRPDFVLIVGQVYNANALAYVPRKNVAWYLKQAGGTTPLARPNAIFVIRANGSVVSAAEGWWGGGALSVRVQPGDTIVVPEKPLGESTAWKNFLSVAEVATSAAISTAILVRR